MPDSIANDIMERLEPFCEQGVEILVRGNCMTPTIENGQRICVKRRRRYRPGDILVFRDHRGRLLAHRLLGSFQRKGERRFVTCADNGNMVDQSMTRDRILGKALLPVSPRQRLRCRARFLVHTANWLWRRCHR